MDKRVKLELKVPNKLKIEYGGVSIEINPLIEFAEEILLINQYIKDFFGELEEIMIPETKYHIFEAECRLKYYIFQINTNIDMTEIDNNIYTDDLLWEAVTDRISNYKSFRDNLEAVVYEVKEQIKLENMLGKALSDILGKVETFVEQIEKISPEDIKQLQEAGTEMIQELEKTSVLRNPSDVTALNTPLVEDMKKE